MNQIKGLLFGLALADAAGAYTEFRTRKALQHTCFTFPLDQRGRDPDRLWTDNTNQTICVVHSIHEAHGRVDPLVFAQHLRDWVEHGFSELGQTQGEGCRGTTFSVVMDDDFLTNPVTTSRRHKSPNGTLVHTVILGCRAGDRNTVIKDTILIAKTTHAESRSVIACCIVASIVFDLVNHTPTRKILHNAFKHNILGGKHHVDIARHCHAFSLDELHLDDTTSGHSLKCLGVAVWAFRERERDFRDIITEIALQGGDASTNACVAGAILGAYKGFDSLPQDWLEQLRHKNFLLEKLDLFHHSEKLRAAQELHDSLRSAELYVTSPALASCRIKK